MPSECIFCGPTDRPITAEHVVPQWVSRVLYPGTDKKKRYKLFHRDHLGRDESWHAKSFDFKAHLLCRVCNNEVFSDLENRVKPVVSPMMLDPRLSVLDTEEQSRLSAWLFKMMLVHHHCYEGKNPANTMFTLAQRRQFRDTWAIPAGVIIWLARFIGNRPNDSSPVAGVLHGYQDSNQLFQGVRTHMFAFSLGQFAAQVLTIQRIRSSAKPLDELMSIMLSDSGWRYATLQLWPAVTPGATVSWPPRAALVRQSMQMLYERFGHENLELWPGEVRRDVPIGVPIPLLWDHAIYPSPPS